MGKLVFDVIDREPLVKNMPNCRSSIDLTKFIKFNQVSFKYPTTPKEFKNILDKVTFQIEAGKSTAIVGPSGVGKSTIV